MLGEDEGVGIEDAAARGDRQYQPFPSLQEFVAQRPELEQYELEKTALAELRETHSGTGWNETLRVLLRTAAVDTGALEGLYTTDRGFTVSVAHNLLTRSQLEVEKGPDFNGHFEAQLEGFEMALDAATRSLPITEAWIRTLHSIICAGQTTIRVHTDAGVQEQTLQRGTYKTTPNHVRLANGDIHPYAPVAETPHEMARLVKILQSAEFDGLHAVVQAAYAHYAFVWIHPFADGNGRVARALTSVFLLRDASIPFTVYADRKDRYLDALQAADHRDYRSFLHYVGERAIDTIRVVLEGPSLKTSISDLAAEVASAYETPAGFSVAELTTRTRELAAILEAKIQSCWESQPIPVVKLKVIRHDVFEGFASLGISSSWHPPPGIGTPTIFLAWEATGRPANVADLRVSCFATSSSSFTDTFLIAIPGRPQAVISYSSVVPDISNELHIRLDRMAEEVVAKLLEAIRDANSQPEQG